MWTSVDEIVGRKTVNEEAIVKKGKEKNSKLGNKCKGGKGDMR